MFRNRTSSQKPGDEFIANFRQNFPAVRASTSQESGAPNPGATALDNPPTGASVAPVTDTRHQSLGHEDLDPTPRPNNEPWRFTPSLLDPNSFAFSNFANQPPGYYTPTPGGVHTLYHNQAGDLHTPGMGMGIGMGLGTPLSLSTSSDGLHAGTMMDMSAFGHSMAPHQFQNYNPFGHPGQEQRHEQHHDQQQQQQQHQSSYAPSSFIHQDTGYETMDHDGSPMEEDSRRLASMHDSLHHSPVMSFQPTQYDMSMVAPMPASAEKFRFHVTLNAPTAMIKHAEEIPVTYLNKGQAYSVSIVDTAPTIPLPQGTRYRTFVRISFEDEQQRQRPATCWQLWKEGRGTNEAHQRGGKLQAVEYVEANQPAESDDKRTRVELDTASFDGFSVIWTPGVNGSSECNVAVRFNFLSTDFSHSKGVKGIPVRLCAKTEIIPTGSPHSVADFSEVAFCKVKLFRDHGAERKLSNDVAHVKKTIDKLKQQIAQAETGMKDFGKRKRGATVATKAQPAQRPGPGKAPKHKRTWSMSSASSAGGGRPPLEEDLHYKLQTMQDMFTSTRPVSILYLRGAEQDDPDLHPVALVGEPLDLTKVDSRTSAVWRQRSDRSSTAGTSSLVSPSPSSMSLQSQLGPSSVPNTAQWADFQHLASADAQTSNPQQLASPPEQVTKIAKTDDSGSLSGWIEALGVDGSYKPPAERPIKPVASFYIMQRNPQQPEKPQYYRAVYLMQRTLKDFTNAIAAKFGLEPTKVLRTLHVLDRGLEVEMDDDVIHELAEGQDLIMEINEVHEEPLKREWEMSVDNVAVDSDNLSATQHVVHTNGYELRLTF